MTAGMRKHSMLLCLAVAATSCARAKDTPRTDADVVMNDAPAVDEGSVTNELGFEPGCNGPKCVPAGSCAVANGGCGDPVRYACTPNPGPAPTCSDIDECATNNGGCGHAALARCTNNVGAPPTCEPVTQRMDTVWGRYYGESWPGSDASLSFGDLQDVDAAGGVYFFDSHGAGQRLFRPTADGHYSGELIVDGWINWRGGVMPVAIVNTDDGREIWSMPMEAGPEIQVISLNQDGTRTLIDAYPTERVALRLVHDKPNQRVYFIEDGDRLGVLDLTKNPGAGAVKYLSDNRCVCDGAGAGCSLSAFSITLGQNGELFMLGKNDGDNRCLLRYDPQPQGGFERLFGFGDFVGYFPMGIAYDQTHSSLFAVAFRESPPADVLVEIALSPPSGAPYCSSTVAGPITDLPLDLPFLTNIIIGDAGDLYATAGFQIIKLERVLQAGCIDWKRSVVAGQVRQQGIPGGQMQLTRPIDLVSDARGNVYVVDRWEGEVYMLDANGAFHTIAGNLKETLVLSSEPRFGPPNTFNAGGGWVSAIALAPNGLYYGHPDMGFISYHDFGSNGVADGVVDVDPEENVSLVVGVPRPWVEPPERDPAVLDGTPAADAVLGRPVSRSMTLLPSHRLVFGDMYMIYALEGGSVRHFAGQVGSDGMAVAGCGGEYVPAVGTPIHEPFYIDSDGERVYFAEPNCGRIRAIEHGLIFTIAGPTGEVEPDAYMFGDPVDGPGPEARFSQVMDVAVAPDGSLVAVDSWATQLRRIACQHTGEPGHVHGPSCEWTVSTIGGSYVPWFASVDGPGGDPVDDHPIHPSVALDTRVGPLIAIDVSPTGAVYFIDDWLRLVRRLFTDDAQALEVSIGAALDAERRAVSTLATLGSPRTLAEGGATLEALDRYGIPLGLPVRAASVPAGSSLDVALAFTVKDSEALSAAAFRQRFCFTDGSCTVIVDTTPSLSGAAR